MAAHHIRLETFYLQHQVPDFRIRIAKVRAEPLIIILYGGGGGGNFAVLKKTLIISIILAMSREMMRNSLPRDEKRERISGMYSDAEREGGVYTSAGEGGVGVYAEAKAEAGG
jgi:hypothetical protein